MNADARSRNWTDQMGFVRNRIVSNYGDDDVDEYDDDDDDDNGNGNIDDNEYQDDLYHDDYVEWW